MRLATVRVHDGTRAVRADGDEYVDLGVADVGTLLAEPDWFVRASTSGDDATRYRTVDVELAPLVMAPGKIVCVGLNYRTHILEMGRELPEYPTLFAKFADALVGANDDIALPPESNAMDWEAELVVVIGRAVRRADEEQAAAAIAGFTIMNDVTMRDWQFRTREWLQGKTFEGTTPLGPVLVTPDELTGGVRPALAVTCTVDGEIVQQADTGDLVFDPVALVRYVSTIGTLRPGDIIATGTPGGVGHARTPPRYLGVGQTVVTAIDGIGQLTNTVSHG
jgi:acylpyruvate hydrolase